MMWSYSQKTGALRSPGGTGVGFGYSGCGEGLNNPAMQGVHDVGPVPRGTWSIGAFFDDPGGKGPLVAHLTPATVEQALGRSGFMIHGDNELENHTASEGCIILPHGLRAMMAAGLDRTLVVTE